MGDDATDFLPDIGVDGGESVGEDFGVFAEGDAVPFFEGSGKIEDEGEGEVAFAEGVAEDGVGLVGSGDGWEFEEAFFFDGDFVFSIGAFDEDFEGAFVFGVGVDDFDFEGDAIDGGDLLGGTEEGADHLVGQGLGGEAGGRGNAEDGEDA